MALDLGLGSVSLEVKLELGKIESDLKRVFGAIEVKGFTAVEAAIAGISTAAKSSATAITKLGNVDLSATAKSLKAIEKAIVGLEASKGAFEALTAGAGALTKEAPKIATAFTQAADKVDRAWARTAIDFEKNAHSMESQAKATGAVLVENLNHSAADTVAAAWRRTEATFDAVAAHMRGVANSTGAAIVNALGRPNLSSLANAANAPMAALQSHIQGVLANIRGLFSRPIGEMSIGGFAVGQMAIDGFKNAFQNLFQFVQQGYQNMAGALAGFTGKALGEAAKIDKSLNVVKSLTGQQDTGNLEAAIVAAGVASSQETGAIAGYTEQLAKSGMDQKAISEALKPIALLADASGEDIGKTGKAVIAAGNAYQLGTKDMAQTSATLLAAATSAQGSTIAGYGKFSQYFKVQSVQGAEGLATSAKIYSLMKSAGVEDAAAGRNLASFYKSLANPSQKQSGAQAEIKAALSSIGSDTITGGFGADGKQRNELESLMASVKAYKELKAAKGDQAAMRMFGDSMGVEAMRQIVALSNQTEAQIAKTLDNVSRKIKQTDLVDAFYKQATSGLAGAKKLLEGSIDGFTAAYGLSLRGAAGTVTGMFAMIAASVASNGDLLKPLTSLSNEFTEFAKTDAFKTLAEDLSGIANAAIGEGINGLIGMFRELQVEFGGTGTLAESLGFALKIPLRGFLLITGGIKDLIIAASQVRKTFAGIFSGEMFGGGENPITKMVGPDMLQGFDSLKTAVVTVWDAIRDSLGVLAPPVLSALGSAFRVIGDVVGAIAPYLATFIRYIAAVTSVGLYEIASVFKLIASVASPVLNVIKSIGIAIAQLGKLGLTAFTAGIQNAFRGFFDIGNAIDGALGNPIRSASKTFDAMVQNFGNGFRGIAISAGQVGGTIASFFVSPQRAVLTFGKSLSNVFAIERFGDFGKMLGTMTEVLAGGGAKAMGGLKLPAIGNIGNPFGAMAIPSYLKPSVDLLINSLKGFVDLFKGSFSSVFDQLGKAVADIGKTLSGGSGSGGSFADLGKALEPLAKPMLLAAVNAVRISIVSLTVAVEALKLAFVLVSGGIQLSLNAIVTNIRIAFVAIQTVVTVAIDAIKITWNSLTAIFTAAGQILRGDFSGAFDTIKNAAASNLGIIGNIFSTIFGGLGSIAGIALEGVGNAFAILTNTGGAALAQLGQIFSIAWAGFSSIASDTMGAIGINWQGFTSGLSSLWSALVSGLQFAWEAYVAYFNGALGLLTTAWQVFTSALTFAWQTAIAAVQLVWDSLKFAIESGISAIGSSWNSMVEAMGSAFSSIISAIQGAMDSLTGTINSVASGISQGIGGAASGLLSTFSSVRSAIESWMQPINDAIGGLQRASSAMGDYASQAANAVGSAASVVTSPVMDFFKGISFGGGAANGGVLPGYSRTDDTLIMARSGEGIIVPEAVRLLGGPTGIERLNRSSERGYLPRFATGGVVGSVGSSPDLQKILGAMAAITKSFPEIQKVIISLGSSVTPDLLTKLGLAIGKLSQTAKDSLSNVVNTQLRSMAGSGGEGISAVARSLGSSVSDAMKPAFIAQQALAAGLTKVQTAYVLATAQHESDQFRVMEEYASGAAYEGRSDLGNTQAGDGERYKGRGFVQLTGRANYAEQGRLLGIDLINRPELAAVPEIAAKILINGMKTGAFTGVGLSDFSGSNFEAMRAIVNGSDQAGLIAGYAQKYATALEQIQSIGSGVTGATLNALNSIAAAAKGSTIAAIGTTGDALKVALARIPLQYRSAIESVLSGATKTLPGELAGYLSQLIPNLTTGSLGGGSTVASRLLATAKSWVGREFNPGVFAQCAAFVRDVFQKSGIGLSETLSRSADGADYGVLEAGSLLKSSIGQVITDKSQILAGDIVMWSKTYGDYGNDITHVGIATGNGMMIDRSTSSAPVRERPIDTFANFVGAVRPDALKSAANATVNVEALKAGLERLGGNLSAMAATPPKAMAISNNEALAKLNAEIARIRSGKGAGGDVGKLNELEKLKTQLETNTIAPAALTEGLQGLGLAAGGLGETVKTATGQTISLIPTMRSLMVILGEGVLSAYDSARRYAAVGNQIERQLQRSDLSNAQRLRALPIAYQQMLGASLPQLPAVVQQPIQAINSIIDRLVQQPKQQASSGGGELKISLDTRSIGGETFVPLSQVQQAIQKTARSVSNGADFRYSYSDRLNNGFG